MGKGEIFFGKWGKSGFLGEFEKWSVGGGAFDAPKKHRSDNMFLSICDGPSWAPAPTIGFSTAR